MPICKNCGKDFPKTRRTRATPVYCSRPCLYADMPQEPTTRFWAKVDKSSDCWIWTGRKDQAGYGAFNYNGRTERAHRVSYLLSKGDIPKGLEVCHACDNPSCVRPEHLWLGTPKENGDDRNQKGRYKTKLTWEQACDIRCRYKPRIITAAALAKEYGVSESAIFLVLTGKLWAERPWRIWNGA